MKLTSAINKLKKCGYKVEKFSDAFYQAKKTTAEIRLYTEIDPIYSHEVITKIYYTKGEKYAVKGENLTKTLRILGDAPDNATQKVLSRESLIKRLVEEGSIALTQEQIKSINIRCAEQLNQVFAELFKRELASTRRYSHSRAAKQRRIEKCKGELWQTLVQSFLASSPDAMPLRSVEISARIDNCPDVKDSWGSRISPEVRSVTPVFARTAEDARTSVKALLGDFAEVSDMGVVVIGPADTALDIYNEYKGPPSAQIKQRREVDQSTRALADIKKRLESAETVLEVSERKLELAKFLDNFASLATISSQGGDVTGEELN